MKKYALIKNGIVLSVFETDKKMSDFPDIAKSLQDVTGKDVKCNDLCHNGIIYKRPDPIEIEVRKGEVEIIAPVVNFVDKSFSWIQFSATIGAVLAAAAAQYFIK